MKKRTLLISAGMLGLGLTGFAQSNEGTIVSMQQLNQKDKVYKIEDKESGLVYESLPTDLEMQVGQDAYYDFLSQGEVNSGSGVGQDGFAVKNNKLEKVNGSLPVFVKDRCCAGIAEDKVERPK